MHVQNAQLRVHDQNEALNFYVGKLGWEVRSDVTMPELGGFRWLTVSPPSQPDFAVVLMAIPGPPVMDSETADQVRSLMAKGFAGAGQERSGYERADRHSVGSGRDDG